MTYDKGIPIRNIFYMLSYAFQTLRRNDFASVASEDFKDAADLFAEILCIGLSFQLKQGLYKEYVGRNENMNLLRGKVNIYNTINNIAANKHQLSCDYDDFSENNIYNQILKSTAFIFLKINSVNQKRKDKIKNILPYLDGIDIIDCRFVNWDILNYHRSNRNYEMLIKLCYLFWQDKLMTTNDGSMKMTVFSDENMARLYEKFILEYYKRHHPELSPRAKRIDWAFAENTSKSFLWPELQSDVYLQKDDKTLIIDAKYYCKILTKNQFDKSGIRSANIFQIYTYIGNESVNNSQNVSGMLLYAKTTEQLLPDEVQTFSDGKKIYVKTLDLNQDFEGITQQLENIVDEYFP